MAAEIDDIILEHVLYIRRAVDRLDVEFDQLSANISSISETMDRIKLMMDTALAQFSYPPST